MSESKRRRVLMIAYACNPEGGGEHWLGWEWAAQAAREYDLHLITTPNAQEAILRHAPQCGITPHFVGLPAGWRFLHSINAGPTSWLRKLVWQRAVLRQAKALHAATPFALVHQTTFHTFRVPFLAASLPIPSLWGPIAGGESVPAGFERFLTAGRWAERWRKALNGLNLRLPSVRRALRNASALWVSNRVTLDFLPPECRAKARIVPPNALRQEDLQPRLPCNEPRPFTLLYAGNCVPTRGLPIAFAALKKAHLPTGWKFFIAGNGPALPAWKQQVEALGLSQQVEFLGSIPREQLYALYHRAHALIFPALRDSGGSALLEAMAKGLPIVCLDWGGPGEMLDAQSGFKLPVANPEATVEQMAGVLEILAREPARGEEVARHSVRRAHEFFTWEAKGRTLRETYQSLIR